MEGPLAKIPGIEFFLDRVEEDLFNNTVYKNVPDNLTQDERKALKKFPSTSVNERDVVIRLQDKGNNFDFMDKNLDHQKVTEQPQRGSFEVLTNDPSLDTCLEIDNWVRNGNLEVYLISGLNLLQVIIVLIQVQIIPLLNTHKIGNPARVITFGCGTPTANLSFFV